MAELLFASTKKGKKKVNPGRGNINNSMAACTQYSNIIVSGAGTTAVNGTYIPYSTSNQGENIYTIWTKDGNDSYPRITVTGSGAGNWAISINTPFPGAPAYYTPADSFGSANCPVGLTWAVSDFGSGDVPTVTGTPNAPDPYAPWGGFDNYRRLRYLEYL